MRDRALINEVRKRVATLEGKYEMIAKDLESARGFLAMLEREFVNDIGPRVPQTQAEILGNAIAEILADGKRLHRKDIRDALMETEIYFGNYDNERKQLAALSSVMSSDPRFLPSDGKWMLDEEKSDNVDVPTKLTQSMHETVQQALVSNGG